MVASSGLERPGDFGGSGKAGFQEAIKPYNLPFKMAIFTRGIVLDIRNTSRRSSGPAWRLATLVPIHIPTEGGSTENRS